PQARETFVGSILNWPELSRAPHADILEWHRRLIQLRCSESSLADGEMKSVQTRFDENHRWLTVVRGAITVACNFLNVRQAVPLFPANHQILMVSESGVKTSSGTVDLPPDSVAILK